MLPSEKAFAYKMKMDAMKRQGIRTDLTSCQNGTKFRADAAMAEQIGESARSIQRYIRLTELIPDLLDYVDKKRLQFTVAVDISYIDKEIQTWLFEYIKENGTVDQWEQELDRIEKTVLKYQKPFFLPKRDVCREKAPGWFRITGNCRENFAWKNSVNGIVQCLKPVRRDHGFVALLYGSGHQSCPLRLRHGRTTAMKYVRNRCRR